MPRFLMSYAYDVPHYADFYIDAPSEKVAMRIAKQALKRGDFSEVVGRECLENECNVRVFCSGSEELRSIDPSMAQLTGKEEPNVDRH